MAALTPYQQAARDGIRAAQREHQRLGTDLTSRIEVFDVIEDELIWLSFRRLGNLYGVYQRYGEACGILINSQHPLSLQRYTAGHEYGHHILGHTASADDEERIQRRPRDLREVAAQAFAGEFLMPLQLVNYTLRTMGLSGKYLPLTARQVYQLALELGVSYRAAVTQLIGQHKLTSTAGQQLLAQSPLAVKTSLAGVRPADSRADLWLLDESQEGRRFSPRLRDEIHVMLVETPSTGYVWQLIDAAPPVLALVDDQFETGDDDIIGASGTRHVAFRVAHAGETRIRLEKRRPWQHNGQMAATFEATLRAIPPLTGDAEDGLSEDQKQALLAGGRAA
jgi:Zn-dependent peptidase ImmA (M78 family)/predicted secreted protein